MSTESRSTVLPNRRRWFQFRLRTLFVVVTVVAIPCGWFAYRARLNRHATASPQRTWLVTALSVGPNGRLAIGLHKNPYDRRNSPETETLVWDARHKHLVASLPNFDQPQFGGKTLLALSGYSGLCEFDEDGKQLRRLQIPLAGAGIPRTTQSGGRKEPAVQQFAVLDDGDRIAYFDGDSSEADVADINRDHNSMTNVAGPFQAAALYGLSASAGPKSSLLVSFIRTNFLESADPHDDTEYGFRFRVLVPDKFTMLSEWEFPLHTHQGVNGVAISPDGKYVAINYQSGKDDRDNVNHWCEIFDAATGKPIAQSPFWKAWYGPFELMDGPVAFSPDSKQLAVVTRADTIALFEVPSGKRIKWFQQRGARIHSVAYSDNGQSLYAGAQLQTASDQIEGEPFLLVWADVEFAAEEPTERISLDDYITEAPTRK